MAFFTFERKTRRGFFSNSFVCRFPTEDRGANATQFRVLLVYSKAIRCYFSFLIRFPPFMLFRLTLLCISLAALPLSSGMAFRLLFARPCARLIPALFVCLFQSCIMKTLTRIQSKIKVFKWRGCGFFNKNIYAVRVLWCCATA